MRYVTNKQLEEVIAELKERIEKLERKKVITAPKKVESK